MLDLGDELMNIAFVEDTQVAVCDRGEIAGVEIGAVRDKLHGVRLASDHAPRR